MSSQLPDTNLDPALYPPSMTTLVEVDKDYGLFYLYISISLVFFFFFFFFFLFGSQMMGKFNDSIANEGRCTAYV
jgi:hypothetical protein